MKVVLLLLCVLVSIPAMTLAGWMDDDLDDVQLDGDFELSFVTCGSVIKLRHKLTGFRLHSHEVNYGGGSGQQSVTSKKEGDDPNSYWIVGGAHDEECPQGHALRHGDKIRLTHMSTLKNLHSHGFPPPLSQGGSEVSCFGNGGEGDVGDNWTVEVPGRGLWKRGAEVRLKHSLMGLYLMSHKVKFNRPISGQQEVKALSGRTQDNLWYTEEGIYFPAVDADE